jgi:hypothetical protein
MRELVTVRKNYYGGALIAAIGAAAIYVSRSYRWGSMENMGPGFFPSAIGMLMVATGILISFSRSRSSKQQHGKLQSVHGLPDFRGAFCLVLGTLAFVLLGEWGGLLPATFAIVFLSALGDRQNTVRQALTLTLAMAGVAVIVFWWALQLQLPLFQWGD